MAKPKPTPSAPSLPEWLGLEVLHDRNGESMVRLRPRPEAHNYRGVVHGGTLATLADVAMGVAANSALGSTAWCITQSMELHYLRPGRGRLVARARTIHCGRSRVVVEAMVTNDAGKGVVKALATFAVMPASDTDAPMPNLTPRPT